MEGWEGEDKKIYYQLLFLGASSLADLSCWASRMINLLCLCPVTASPPGPLWTSSWVLLNCSFSRPDLPASVHWFRGPGRVPVQESPHHHLVGNFLFLPHVSSLDSGTWGCSLTYRDGFNVSITYNLAVLGNSSSLPSHSTTTPTYPLTPSAEF